MLPPGRDCQQVCVNSLSTLPEYTYLGAVIRKRAIATATETFRESRSLAKGIRTSVSHALLITGRIPFSSFPRTRAHRAGHATSKRGSCALASRPQPQKERSLSCLRTIARLSALTMGILKDAPEEPRMASSLTGAPPRLGMMTTSAPAPTAERMIAPRFLGLWTPSRTTAKIRARPPSPQAASGGPRKRSQPSRRPPPGDLGSGVRWLIFGPGTKSKRILLAWVSINAEITRSND